ncbi:MAG TPA: hypothetical protein VM095_12335 [Pyrinomonadaceae bacterium]|nr:hypothetical protein [Pyrinomonadaceae bacterium]
MFKKFASPALIAALACPLCGPKAFAQHKPQAEAEAYRVNDSSFSNPAGEKGAQPNDGLKAHIQKLVSEARAGKGLSAIPDPQNQPKQSNSLSKSVEIGLVVGIALAIVITIVVIHARNHLFDDFGPITVR